MTYEQLRSFVTTAKYLSFTKAADNLFVNQTTISRSVQSLENELGVKLFKRSFHGLTLTEMGAFFLEDAEFIMVAMETAVRKIKNFNSATKSILNIKIAGNYYLPVQPIFASFIQQYPTADVNIDFYLASEGKDIFQSLDDGSADLIFCLIDHIPSSSVSGYRIRRIYTDTICALVGMSHPLAKKDSLSLRDLSGQNIFVGNFYLPDVDSPLKETMTSMSAAPYRITHISDEYEMGMRVSAGQGICFAPASNTFAQAWKCKKLPFSDFDWQKDLFMVWSSENSNPTLRRFLDTALNSGPIK